MDKTIYMQIKCCRYARYGILILIISLLFSCKQSNNEVRILFVGDVLLSRMVKEEYRAHKIFPWEDLRVSFDSADFVVGNLEGAVGIDTSTIASMNQSPVFAIDSTDISMLRQAGFSAMSVENNHSLDLGVNGKLHTISALNTSRIRALSLDNSPQFFSAKNVVVALVSINEVLSRDSSKTPFPSVELRQKMRLARQLSNVVVVTIHWGSELLEWPSREQRDMAKWLVTHGVDVIIGSHPHVIQQPELINGKPVFFSLGNHLFDQKYPQTKEGLMVDLRVSDGAFYCTGYITHTKRASFYPQITKRVEWGFKPINYKSLLSIDNYTLCPLSLINKGRNCVMLQAYKKDSMLWCSHPMPLVAIEVQKLDGENQYIFALEKYYSSLDKEVTIRPYVYSVDEKGLFARWRGSALAWPMVDAKFSSQNAKVLCAQHRGDSYILLDKNNTRFRIAAYRWNGFGFTGLNDSLACSYCSDEFK